MRKRSIGFAVAVLSAASVGGLLRAQPGAPEHPVVVGYEQLRDAAGDAELGAVLLGELNCLSCHLPAGRQAAIRVDTKPAPDLRRIGRRATPDWLEAFVVDPHATKPGTTMPALLHDLPADERERLAEDLTHFLVDQSDAEPRPAYEPFRFRAAVERGRDLYHAVGCVACHAPESGAVTSTPSVPLPDLAAKTHVTALAEFLRDPESVRYGSRMPSLHLTEGEATDLAVYLLRDQEPERPDLRPGFEFEYYAHPPREPNADGTFDEPEFDMTGAVPDMTGRVGQLTLQLPGISRTANHSVRFSALLRLADPGTYTFVLRSDRPAEAGLRIDGNPIAATVADSVRAAEAEVRLRAGTHEVEITYTLHGGTSRPLLAVTVDGGSLVDATNLARMAVYERIVLKARAASGWEVDPARAARGRRAFAALGCSACHALASAPTDIGVEHPARAMESLSEEAELSAEWSHSGPGSPSYRLAPEQRRAIAAALADPEHLGRPRATVAQIGTTLATYGCLSCHLRGDGDFEIGGPDPERAAYFQTVGDQDLGDEGRFPPLLTAVGGKLRREALAAIFRDDRLHIRRGTMQTRMPAFAGDAIAALPALFEAEDAIPGDLDEPPFYEDAVRDGLRLVGSSGLRCIACHDVGDAQTFGVSVANLAHAAERLRPGWLAFFLRDPLAINAGTRMPQYWADDTVIFDEVAGGTADGQIDAIWSYLSLGASMPTPLGMDFGDALVLDPSDRPLVFRTFMTDASPRAIAVGYPEAVHAAFDANVQRLVKVWRGSFFDAAGTWSGRAGQFFDPQGTDVLVMPPGPAFAHLPSPEAPWPLPLLTDRDVGGEFRGYRFDEDRRPVFRYVLNEVEISEQPLPVRSADGAHLVRRFTLATGSATEPLYLLAAEGGEIVAVGDGVWRVDDRQTITLRSSVVLEPRIRTSQGAAQLLVPVPVGAAEPVTIDLEIQW